MSQLRIAICIPSYNVWSAASATCVARMVAHFAGGVHLEKPAIEVFNTHGCVLPSVRCDLVARAIEWKATHILFVDADMQFPPDALLRLLRHKVLIVGANYVRRGLPTFPTAYLPGGMTGKTGVLWTEPGDDRLIEVQHVATGLMLIDVRVFECIDFPWFDFGAPPMPGPEWTTDDVYFCRKVRAVDIPIYCDQGLSWEVGHVGEMVYTHAMGLECRKQETAHAVSLATTPVEAPASIPDAAD